jgi:hypothetical protein
MIDLGEAIKWWLIQALIGFNLVCLFMIVRYYRRKE